MAAYTRFEVYLPVHFSVSEVDQATGATRVVRRALDETLVAAFMREAADLFGGVTQAHPMGNPPSRGMWVSREHGDIAIDDLTYLFVLAPVHQFDAALQFFETWRARFVAEMHQEAILVTYSAVNVIGGFL
jgi:hypothetical protein